MGVTTEDGVSRLVGFDDIGETFVSDGRVLRGIYRGKATGVRGVLQACIAHDLFRDGIIATREVDANVHAELGYEMMLEHARVPFVTFPHEWPASMLHSAAKLHLRLFQKLGEHGLTLKDWHPYNILFDGTEPVFVDFTSIIPAAELPKQGYLADAQAPGGFGSWDEYSVALYRMYCLTYEPYFGLPLAMMQQGRHAEAREKLVATALNATDSGMLRGEVFAGQTIARARYELNDLRLRMALNEKGPVKTKFFALLSKMLDGMHVAVRGSAYSSYYEDKKEAFASEPSIDWTNKQNVVHDALVRFDPATVLDIGSNTGWFSLLAAKLGSNVVGVDLDEACIDSLFAAARRERLPVMPLVANLIAPPPDIFAKTFENEPSLSKIGGEKPLYPSPEKRLECEMVMALAIVHHLALGQGHSFERIASTLSGLASRYLCVEFVQRDDKMVVDDPGFFPAMVKSPGSFGWYTVDGFVAALRRHFDEIQVLPSYPSTRLMLLCSRF
jgi:SAM-dependent methyltransferase